MKKSVLSLVLVVIITAAFGQSPGPFFRQFSFNPYLFNPAYVAINDRPELNIAYRKQWINFQDAPITTGISLQYPTPGRVSLGLNITNDQQALLTNNTFMGTFGYTVPISKGETLRFGLSAGVGTNRLDLTSEGINLNDPAIINAANNNTYVDGNFGVVYTNQGLRVGFALTEIFKSNPFNTESFNKFTLSNLKNRLYSASYKFNVGLMENFALEPYILYRQSEDGLQDAWEAATMVYYKDILWTGASYNQNNGLGLFLGMNVMNKFRFSYSYEFPPFGNEFISSNSHEIHVGIQFGDKKSRALVKNPVKRSSTLAKSRVKAKPVNVRQKEQKVVEAEAKSAKEQQVETTPATKTNTISQSRPETAVIPVADETAVVLANNTSTEKPPATKPVKSFTISKGHYVVVGAFSIMSYATRYARTVRAKGYTADITLNPQKKLYYVYIYSSFDLDEAKKVRNQYRFQNLFKEAWVYSME